MFLLMSTKVAFRSEVADVSINENVVQGESHDFCSVL